MAIEVVVYDWRGISGCLTSNTQWSKWRLGADQNSTAVTTVVLFIKNFQTYLSHWVIRWISRNWPEYVIHICTTMFTSDVYVCPMKDNSSRVESYLRDQNSSYIVKV